MHYLRSALKIALPFALGGAILWWMYRGFEWGTLRTALSSGMRWEWMWLSFPFGIMAQVLRGLRWRQLLAPMGERARRSTCVHAVFASYASSLVVPRVGEVLRCGVLRRYDGVGMTRSIGTVVTERVVDMAMIMLFSLGVFLWQVPAFVLFARQTGIGTHMLAGRFTTAGWVVTIVSIALIIATTLVLLRRLQLLTRTKAILSDLRQGLLSVTHVQRPLLFMAYSAGIWACYFLHFYLTFFCFDSTAQLGISVAAIAFVVGTFAVLVPTPNGAGPWHFAVKTVCMLFGVASDDGAIFALIVHTLQTLLVAALGIEAAVALTFTSKRGTAQPPSPSPTDTQP